MAPKSKRTTHTREQVLNMCADSWMWMEQIRMHAREIGLSFTSISPIADVVKGIRAHYET